jgi:hypothetical protein
MMTPPLTSTDSKTDRRRGKVRVAPKSVERFADELFAESVHQRRVDSIALGVVGVVHAVSLSIHAIGRGLSAVRGKDAKHGTKQVDRLLSNSGVQLPVLFESWVRFIVGDRKEIVLALDWTEFDGDNQATICLYMITRHGRATPLVWKTVPKATLAGKRNDYEYSVVEQLGSIVPPEVEGVRFSVFLDGASSSRLGIRWRGVVLGSTRRIGRALWSTNGPSDPSASRGCVGPSTAA